MYGMCLGVRGYEIDSPELFSSFYGLCPLSSLALGILAGFGLLLCFVLSFFLSHTYIIPFAVVLWL